MLNSVANALCMTNYAAMSAEFLDLVLLNDVRFTYAKIRLMMRG